MNEIINSNNTFWKLINSHRIEIPIIQRDYAQGRIDAKVTQIREGFVRDLVDSLEQKSHLPLDFIYGKINGKTDSIKIENNKKAIANLLSSIKSYSNNLDVTFTYQFIDETESNQGLQEKRSFFIPLDGQQRLTTLYLLHWYLCSKLHLKDKIKLTNFSYKTRRSSKDFCNALVSNHIEIGKDSLSSKITDSAWFFTNWEKDPTVRSMLIVINEIHDNLKNKELGDLVIMWKNLTELDLITFEFLDLEEFELTDQLYVKMNARGKHLSDFEKFKAWLQEDVKKNNGQIEITDWHKRLDIEWIDLFWEVKDAGKYEIDKEYLTFFNSMALYFYSEKVEILNNSINEEDKGIIDKFRNADFIPQSIYEKYDCFNNKNLNKIFSVLNALQGHGINAVGSKLNRIIDSPDTFIFKKLLGSENSKINLWDRTYLYAFIKFLILKDKNVNDYTEIDGEQFFEWMRVCKNLIYNTAIDSPVDFVQAIIEINKLLSSWNSTDSFYNYLRIDNNAHSISFLSPYQIEEESLKSKLVLEDRNWEEIFIKYENHEYFYGQIRFLIDFSKTESGYEIEQFKKYAEKASVYFDKDILENEEYILQRALLTKGNYLINSGSNRGFGLPSKGTLRNREENWRRFLKNSPKNEILKLLLDDDRSLNEITLTKVNDWRDYVISEPELIRYCKQRFIRLSTDGQYVMLLNSSTMTGYHVEMYSYYYYLNFIKGKKELYKPFTNENYYQVKGNDETPCAYIEEWRYQSHHYAIDLFYDVEEQQYKIHFFERQGRLIDKSIEEILLKNNFKLSEDKKGLILYLFESEIDSKLKTICNSFQNLVNN